MDSFYKLPIKINLTLHSAPRNYCYKLNIMIFLSKHFVILTRRSWYNWIAYHPNHTVYRV